MIGVLISFVSAKGSPGVTTATLALAAAWPRTAVVVDADPVGGDFAAGLGCGTWPPSATLLELVAQSRSAPVDTVLRKLAVRPAEHAPLALAGIGGAAQTATLPWADLAAGFRTIGDADVLCDSGRYVHIDGNVELLRGSDVVVVVTRSSLPSVRSTARLVDLLRETLLGRPAPRMLVIDPAGPYNPFEIAGACGLPLLGTFPLDPKTAAVWSDGATPGRHMHGAALTRNAKRLAVHLVRSESVIR